MSTVRNSINIGSFCHLVQKNIEQSCKKVISRELFVLLQLANLSKVRPGCFIRFQFLQNVPKLSAVMFLTSDRFPTWKSLGNIPSGAICSASGRFMKHGEPSNYGELGLSLSLPGAICSVSGRIYLTLFPGVNVTSYPQTFDGNDLFFISNFSLLQTGKDELFITL